MKISLNELKHYVTIPDGVSDRDLIDLIGSRLVEVEEVIELAPKYEKSYIVKVVSAEKIPDTHLTLCQIDAGEHTAEFSDGETVQVVCGAPNVHAGMLAVWLAPGAIVPSTFGGEDFRLGTRKLRGYESNGMLAALDELDLGTDHAGIVEIDPRDARPGDSFAEKFELNDTIIDVENKSLTHRPDCFGLIGFAREVSGILGQKFTEPEEFTDSTSPKISAPKQIPIEVEITDPELCPRYTCAVLDLPDNQPSKFLTPRAVFLAKAGMRAISPLVDLTNYIMLQTGQPLHAFDYDKLVSVGGTKDPHIIVRAAKPGEPLQLLDGKTIECTPDDILITSNNVPVALAGAMGGKNTEIDASTRRIVLESATFSLYHLRKTQMAHGIFSEAITRFTKGQPAAQTLIVLGQYLKHYPDVLAVVDDYPVKQRKNVVKITTEQVNNLLGTEYTTAEITRTLENVGFTFGPTKSKSTKTVSSKTKRFSLGKRFDVVINVTKETRTIENPNNKNTFRDKLAKTLQEKIDAAESAQGKMPAADKTHGYDEKVEHPDNLSETAHKTNKASERSNDFSTDSEASREGADVRGALARDTRDDGLARRASREDSLGGARSLLVTAPFWRTDIHLPEDLIEEIGRLLGYDNIPLTLPMRPFSGTEVTPILKLKSELREILSDRLAMHELLTYSFVSRDLLAKVGQNPDESYEITNSISPELQCFRQQISPSLLSKVRENLKSGYDNFSLYELNQVTRRSYGLTDDGTPVMHTNLGIVSIGDFYRLKAQVLAATRKGLRVALEYVAMTPNSRGAELFPYLEPVRSANILLNGEVIGAFGEVKSSVLRRLKIERPVAACELNLDALLDLPRELAPNLRLSKFPFVERDLTLKVASSAAFGRFYNTIAEVLDAEGLVFRVTPASIYQPSAEDDFKNISFHLKFSSSEKTLDQPEITTIMDKVTVAVVQLGAEIV